MPPVIIDYATFGNGFDSPQSEWPFTVPTCAVGDLIFLYAPMPFGNFSGPVGDGWHNLTGYQIGFCWKIATADDTLHPEYSVSSDEAFGGYNGIVLTIRSADRSNPVDYVNFTYQSGVDEDGNWIITLNPTTVGNCLMVWLAWLSTDWLKYWPVIEDPQPPGDVHDGYLVAAYDNMPPSSSLGLPDGFTFVASTSRNLDTDEGQVLWRETYPIGEWEYTEQYRYQDSGMNCASWVKRAAGDWELPVVSGNSYTCILIAIKPAQFVQCYVW